MIHENYSILHKQKTEKTFPIMKGLSNDKTRRNTTGNVFPSLILHKTKDDGFINTVNMGEYDNRLGHQKEKKLSSFLLPFGRSAFGRLPSRQRLAV
jgi:hypothetical protein